jgi:hypothetical protein
VSVAERPGLRRHLGGELITVPAFITPPERRELLAWAKAMEPHMRANASGAGRHYQRIENLPHTPNIHRRVRLRLQAFMGVAADAAPEPVFGWYVSIISDGGAVQLHRDPTPPGTRHLRCNLFLQVPESGGRPVVADQPIDVEERMVLAFFPSEQFHSSEPAVGSRRRVMCSFGYLVPESYRLP